MEGSEREALIVECKNYRLINKDRPNAGRRCANLFHSRIFNRYFDPKNFPKKGISPDASLNSSATLLIFLALVVLPRMIGTFNEKPERINNQNEQTKNVENVSIWRARGDDD